MTSAANNPSVRSRLQPLLDILLVMGVSVGAFLLELLLSDRLPWGQEARGLLGVLAGAGAVLVLTRVRGGGFSYLGFKPPRRWWTFPLWVVGIFVVFVMAQNAVPVVLSNWFEIPQPDMSRYDHIRGNSSAALTMALLLPLTAAIPEEIVYRGFLVQRLREFFGANAAGGTTAVLVQALIFAGAHFQWGMGGMLMTFIMGAVWGFAFLLCGRNLWVVIGAHSAAHIALVAQLYHSAPLG
ncbi:MAG: type II CAAX endopeptidase family protein [Xanthomonadales bacterium]|nr:type II CAAX endopeptidase family protein [Xanthomonadales bacterium]